MQNVDVSLFDNHRSIVYVDPHFQKPGRIDLVLEADVFDKIFLEKKPNF